MAKRRSKKQKETAKHQFTISYTPTASDGASKSAVKRQTKAPSSGTNKDTTKPEKALNKAEQESFTRSKREIVRSLGLASLVLGLEIVIYLVSRR